MHLPRIRGLCSVSWCLAEGQWNGDQRRPMGRKAREGLYLSYSLGDSGGPPLSTVARRLGFNNVLVVELLVTYCGYSPGLLLAY